MTALAPHLTAFLREHLPRERAVSPHTVKTYANCFVLLVRFASDRLKRRPTDLEIEAREMLRLRDRLYHLYAEASGQDVKRIEADCDRNKWLDDEEMVEYGLVDKVLTRMPRVTGETDAMPKD